MRNMCQFQSIVFLTVLFFGRISCAPSCEECISEGKVFTPNGCETNCLMDTWCYTTYCPALQDIVECDQCHAFGGDFSLEAGCNTACPMDVSCYKNGIDDCPQSPNPFFGSQLPLPFIQPPTPALDYDRMSCIQCLSSNDTVFTSTGCVESECDSSSDLYCYEDVSECVSNCDFCVQQPGMAFTPQGCEMDCLADTWCYQDMCEAINEVSDCPTCHDFGGYFKVGEGCLEMYDGCDTDSECYTPAEGCPDLSGISDCQTCVNSGGYFTGSGDFTIDDDLKNTCLSTCLYFLPCISECP